MAARSWPSNKLDNTMPHVSHEVAELFMCNRKQNIIAVRRGLGVVHHMANAPLDSYH